MSKKTKFLLFLCFMASLLLAAWLFIGINSSTLIERSQNADREATRKPEQSRLRGSPDPDNIRKIDPISQQAQQQDEKARRELFERRLSPEVKKAVADLGVFSTKGLEKQVSQGGQVTMDLKGRYRSVPVAVRDEAGNIQVDFHGESYVDTVKTEKSGTQKEAQQKNIQR